jgi:hypothetical protein
MGNQNAPYRASAQFRLPCLILHSEYPRCLPREISLGAVASLA